MQVNVSFTRARSAILAVGGLLCLITLSGCAGGGGGGGLSTLPSPFVYPVSLKDATPSDTTVNGFITPYARNTSTPELVSTSPTVSGTSSSSGIITITVNPITLPDSTTEPGFSVEFDPASTSSKSVTTNSPFDNLPTPCTSCLKTVDAYAIVGGTTTPTKVTFTYLDPLTAGLNYSVLGIWEKPTTNGSTVWPEVGGAFSAGVLTRGIDLPTTGSASYSGYFLGRYVTAGTSGTTPKGTYLVGANASATANFTAGTVSFLTSGTYLAADSGGGALGTPVLTKELNLSSSVMPIVRSSTSNSFAGTATTNSGGLSGPIKGGFYGPPATSGDFAPPELGGSLQVYTSSNDQSMAGSFALHK